MKNFFQFPFFCVLLTIFTAQAQGLRPTLGGGAGGQSTASRATLALPVLSSERASDFIVALVDNDPITNQEVQAQARKMADEQSFQGRARPDVSGLLGRALEQLIFERSQLQFAKESGVNVSEAEIDRMEQDVASRNQLTVDDLRDRVQKQGLSVAQFRQNLKNQQVLQRLREKEVPPRIKISEAEIDAMLIERKSLAQNLPGQIHLAQILIPVPETASNEQIKELQLKAQSWLKELNDGADFSQMARERSTASDARLGGSLGLRTTDKYPALFIDATKNTPVNGLAGPVLSGAGFHILRVLEKIDASEKVLTIPQTHASHILLRLGGQQSQSTARAQLAQVKQRIERGELAFEDAAKELSQDASASSGGDLGWASPGQFVPEFEDAMNVLQIGEISNPVVSRFGVHIIKVLGRREAAMSTKEEREYARNILRERKYDDAYETWSYETRGRVYIEYRESPI
jgi:peptidyl-prolyl cis-trans isomerase SurA